MYSMDIVSSLGTVGVLIFWFIVLIIPLVIVHELGHTLMAWLMKIRVVEFGVGLPPRTSLTSRFKNMLLSLNWIPAGGFAKIYGDHDALDRAVGELPSKGIIAREQYVKDRILEAVDNDLPNLLANNGIEYSKDWKSFLSLLQKNSWIIRNYSNEGSLKEGWNAAGKLSDADAVKIESSIGQLEKLAAWELDGMSGSKTAFFNRGFLPKFLVLIGGVLFNYIFAWLLVFGLLNFGHIVTAYTSDENKPQLNTSQFLITKDTLSAKIGVVGQVESADAKLVESPAAAAKIPSRSEILTVNGKNFSEFKTLAGFKEEVQVTQGSPISVTYKDVKTKEIVTTELTPVKNSEGKYLLGMSFVNQLEYKSKNFFSSFGATTTEVNRIVGQIWNGLGDVFRALLPSTKDKSALENVGGPVAIAGIGSTAFDVLGLQGILYIMALISLSLAVMNLLPLPVLDGGRILIALAQKITGKRNRKLEAFLINGTMLLMLGLFVLIAYRDVNVVRGMF